MRAQKRPKGKRLKKKHAHAQQEAQQCAPQRALTQQHASRDTAALLQRSSGAKRSKAAAIDSPAGHAGGSRRAARGSGAAAATAAAPAGAVEEAVGPSPSMLAKARRRYFAAAEKAFSLDAAHDALVTFVLSDDRELVLPPVNDAQRCGVRALATMFGLAVASRGPKRQREYAVHKTRAMRGALPVGKAELSVARLLAAKTDCKSEMQDVCERVLALAGLESRRAKKRRSLGKTQQRAERDARPEPSEPPPQPPPPPPPSQVLPPPLHWFIDRSGAPGRAAAAQAP